MKKFKVRIFCHNCYKESILTFEKGTDLQEVGVGINKSIKVDLPNEKWSIAECPKCGSDKLNRRI